LRPILKRTAQRGKIMNKNYRTAVPQEGSLVRGTNEQLASVPPGKKLRGHLPEDNSQQAGLYPIIDYPINLITETVAAFGKVI